jgi:hypothetical protein
VHVVLLVQLTDFAFTLPNMNAVVVLPSPNPLPVT